MKKILLPVLLGLIVLSSCGDKPAPMSALDSLKAHIADFDTATEADYKYMAEKIAPGIPYELNLADDRQYRFMISGFLKSGLKVEEAQQFFSNLRKLRGMVKKAGHPRVAKDWASATARQSEEYLAFGDMTTSVDSNANPAQNLNLMQYMREMSTGSYTYEMSGLSSLLNQTNNTMMYFTMQTVQNPNPYYTSPTYKAYGAQTLNFQAKTSATVPSGQQGQTVMSYVIIAPSNAWPVTMAAVDNSNAISQCVTAPNYQQHQMNPSTCPPTGSVCINSGNISSPIVSCYGRNDSQAGNCGVCNYGWTGSGYPPNFNLNISGSMKFPMPIAKNQTTGVPSGVFQMYLQKSQAGGCVLNYLDSVGWMMLPAANFSVSPVNDSILNYCFPAAAFANNQCLTTAQNTVYLNISVSVMLTGGLPGQMGNAVVSSNLCSGLGEAWCAAMPNICVVQGCLREGTMVRLADGTEIPIEKLHGGGEYSVVANTENVKHQIHSVSDGAEGIPMYRISTGNGKSVCMSSKHAVPTKDGIKLAKDLVEGDIVTTISGESPITRIVREKWAGKVYNLYTGSETEAAKGQTTFFADGILVGDMGMQKYYTNLPPNTDLKVIFNKLPPEWQKDMKNYMGELQEAREKN